MSLYDNAVEEARDAKTPIPAAVSLAKVTSLTNGKANVQFYGDSSPSTKLYTYIEGYKPAVDDIVCMLAQGNTYIIIGKIANASITNNYKPLASEIAGTYETQSHASDTYETQSHASDTYETQSHASETYRGKNDYFDRLGSGNNNITLSGTEANINGTINLGNNTYRFRSVTTTYTDTDAIRTPNGTAVLSITAGHVDPPSNNGTSIGTSTRKINNLYATNIYGSVADSSDRRLKKSIKTLGHKWLNFFYRLRPTSFKYKDGESGRTHTGFIAQEVEEAAKDAGIERQDIAAIVVDEDGRYYLRYEELIAVQTLAIQDLSEQIADLRARVINLERSANR